jgi:hypothetical protein
MSPELVAITCDKTWDMGIACLYYSNSNLVRRIENISPELNNKEEVIMKISVVAASVVTYTFAAASWICYAARNVF